MLVYSPQFVSQASIVNAWWIDNRPAAQALFEDELKEALAAISEDPEIGLVFTRTARGDVRRLLLRRTRYHVYYRIDHPRVLVLSVWSARRGVGPLLG